MGLGNSEMPRKRYINISKGSFTMKNSDGVKELYKDFTGRWVGYEYRTGDDAKYGTELHLLFVDGRDVYDLGMSLKGGYARSFMRTMENIVDLTKPITLYPQYKEDDSGKNGWLALFQDDKQIPAKYTAKNLGECPDRELVDDPSNEGKKIPNYSKQVAFLRNILDAVMVDRLKKAAAVSMLDAEVAEEAKSNSAPPNGASAGHVVGADEDDLPF